MDTKTPRILQKYHERPHQRKQERKQTEVFLPPLSSLPTRQQRSKIPGTPWSRGPPYIPRPEKYQQERSYRILPIGATPLMHACQQGDKARVLKLLKEQRETTDYRDRTLRNALHYCMDAGTGGAVAAMAPELVNAPDAEGHTPLHLAVIAGDTQLVAILLANGADVNAKDLEGHSILHWATVCGEAECVRLVLAAGARPSTPDLRGGSPLHYAAQCCGVAATAELAVPKKVGLNVLQTLLEFGADVNAKDEDGRQPILWAASAGSVEAVLALARADRSTAAGASDKDGLTALHCAASRGHARCIEALVNMCGSQPDYVDDNGCLALHYSATLGHADATALLLRLGSDPNRQDRKGRTPALCAAAKGQLETLKILAQYGGSLYVRTIRGTGVAHEAVTSGRIELIKWLSKKHPSTLDVATHDGRTPLHVAALHGHIDACKILLDHGARFNAVLRTSKGNLMTALDAALYKGHRDCAKLIQMHGGTTAHQLRAHKTAPHTVFAAKLHVKHIGSSTGSDSSPSRRRRRHSNWEPPFYYEERCIERRTRRKGNLETLDRRNSRSCSEEVRLSKISRKDRGRRTRSESARYDSECNGKKIKQRKSKRRLKKYKHDYDESSTESEGQNYSDHATVRTILRRRTNKRMMPKDEVTNEKMKEKQNASSVSDDSLEVVIVRKSVEKKTEKVVSGRRSKTPREGSKGETVLSKNQENLGRKSKAESVIKESIKVVDKTYSSKSSKVNLNESKKSAKSEEGLHAENDVQDEPEEEEESIVRQKAIHQRDVTDSTSQETVEHVTVTAMVHKDQTPDIPKSTSEERTLKDRQEKKEKKKEAKHQRESSENLKIMRPHSSQLTGKSQISSGKSKIDHILEKADKMQSTILLKAADFKKEVEEMSQEFQEDEPTENIGSRIVVEKEKKDDEVVVRGEVQEFDDEIISEEITNGVTTVKDRKCIEVETTDISSEDSQKECSPSSSQTEKTSSLKAGNNFLNEKINKDGEIDVSTEFLKNNAKDEQVNSEHEENTKKSPSFESLKFENVSNLPGSKKQRDKVKVQYERDFTPRTAVEDVPASDIENEPTEQDEETKSSATFVASKSRPGTAKAKFLPDSKRSEFIQKSPSKLSEAEDNICTDEKKNRMRIKRGSNKKHRERISTKSNSKKTLTTRKTADGISDGKALKFIDEINGDRTPTSSKKESRNERKGVIPAEETPSCSIDKFHDGSDEYRVEEFTREKFEDLSRNTIEEKRDEVSLKDDNPIATCTNKSDDKEFICKRSEVAHFQVDEENKSDEIEGDEKMEKFDLITKEDDSSTDSGENLEIKKAPTSQPENFQLIDDTERKTSDSLTSVKLTRNSRQSRKNNNQRPRSSKSPTKRTLIESSKEYLPNQSAIVAVIDSSEWEEDEDEEINKEISEAIGEDVEHDTEPEEDDNIGVVRVLPSMSEDETPRTAARVSKTPTVDSLPQVRLRLQPRLLRTQSPQEDRRTDPRIRHRRNSGGRDSGIEPSPRISRIPKKTTKCYLNTEKQRTLNMETITRDVQISLRRYYLERKIFFQLMELKRLQIRHGRANEQVLVKRQVETFHKTGATGPTLGVAKYDQPLTFRHFEAFLYEQLRQLQRRSNFPNWCMDAKQCTQKTYRCHHATSAYTSLPVYTYLGGGVQNQGANLLPKLKRRGRGQMTVEVTHGEERQVIALPAERLDRSKRYFVTFTVRGEAQETENLKSTNHAQRNTKSV